MSVTIREAHDADGRALVRLVAACFAEFPNCVLAVDAEMPDLRTFATSHAAKGGQAWVAVDADDHVVGCVAWRPSDDPGRIELKRMYVDGSARRRGVARALADLVHDAAAGRGVECWSDTRFTGAHAFYESLGYLRSGREQALYDLSDTVEYHFERPQQVHRA